MAFADQDRRDRAAAAAAALAVQALLVAALVFGLRIDVPALVQPALSVFAVASPRPPMPVRQRAQARRAAGKAAPPHRTVTASPVVAPVPVIVLPPPPPVLVVAPVPNLGVQAEQGAAAAGSGTGAGGQGDGTGSGGAGTGTGGEIPLRRIRGRLKDSDYPPGALAAGVSGTVFIRFRVGVDGRVHDCRVTKSSGSAELDETTCRLITQRFRYRPTVDASGRKVPDTVEGEHHWETTRRAADAPAG